MSDVFSVVIPHVIVLMIISHRCVSVSYKTDLISTPCCT